MTGRLFDLIGKGAGIPAAAAEAIGSAVEQCSLPGRAVPAGVQLAGQAVSLGGQDGQDDADAISTALQASCGVDLPGKFCLVNCWPIWLGDKFNRFASGEGMTWADGWWSPMF